MEWSQQNPHQYTYPYQYTVEILGEEESLESRSSQEMKVDMHCTSNSMFFQTMCKITMEKL